MLGLWMQYQHVLIKMLPEYLTRCFLRSLIWNIFPCFLGIICFSYINSSTDKNKPALMCQMLQHSYMPQWYTAWIFIPLFLR